MDIELNPSVVHSSESEQINILKEYMKKGFALDDERLKNLGGGGYLHKSRYRKRFYGTYNICRKSADIERSCCCEKLSG